MKFIEYRSLINDVASTISGDSHLAFLELGSTSGVATNFLPKTLNASSPAIDIPGGFNVGTDLQTSVYVSLYSDLD